MSTIKFTYVAKQGEGLRDIVEKQITELLKDHITLHKKQKLGAIKKFTREVLAESKFDLSVNVLTKYQRIFPVRCTRHKTLEALISDSYCNSWKNITIRKGYIVKATFDLDKGSVKIDVTDHVVNEYGVNIVLGASYFDMRAAPSDLQSCDKLGAVLPLFFRIKELKWQAGIGFVAVPENPELKSVGVDLLCNAYMAPWPPQPKKNVKPSTQ